MSAGYGQYFSVARQIKLIFDSRGRFPRDLVLSCTDLRTEPLAVFLRCYRGPR